MSLLSLLTFSRPRILSVGLCCTLLAGNSLAQQGGGDENFTAAIYTRYYEVQKMADTRWMEASYARLAASVKAGKIYLETHRDRQLVDEATLNQAIAYFRGQGLEVAGGITLTISEPNRFETFCYSKPEDREIGRAHV